MIMQKLERQLNDFLLEQTGDFAIVVKDLQTKETLSINEEKIFPSASLIKLPILITLFEQVQQGQFTLSDTLTLEKKSVVLGSGILKELTRPHRFSLYELAMLMIIVSDNTATNLLIDYLSMEKINQAIHRLGLKQTKLQRKMMDNNARKAGKENVTTAKEMTNLFEQIALGKCIDAQASSAMYGILSKQQVKGGLDRYLPQEIKIAHKTGDLDRLEHDCGIIYFDQTRYVVSILTNAVASNQKGREIIGSLSKIIFDFLTRNHRN